ncbi:hypothetical protein [Nostoc punctiforme]|uniref:Uncharacterized protein n=1 Tax=Nostoc punctiforme (strain ATCC 29133 / PCC 73102) TaxID=63737 RepID=B2J319_NOSP7|nr:hypothetical protein [Nostoc punctiforme]ACC82086.1 conserved hypothetical protein [Nostoc punctiforme PCC 73102]
MFNNSNNSQASILYRHGDVLIRHIASLPVGAQKRLGATLAHGEITGHSHRIQQADAVQLWVHGSDLFLEVKEPSATLVHEEHRAIELPQGLYRVWKQREYRPDAYMEVVD